jgi:hypothetical protein
MGLFHDLLRLTPWGVRSMPVSIPKACRALAILLMPALALGQSPPDHPAPPTTIQITSRIVYVDVVVRDTYGRIVRGLTQKDFQVLEDGKSQKIHCQFPRRRRARMAR